MRDWKSAAHRRFNPLTGRWVLNSPHRIDRPWQGEVEHTSAASREPYDPQCYLCPGNARANGERNPEYAATFAFENDFAALRPGTPPAAFSDGLLLAEPEPGTCRVLCFSPRHDLDVAKMQDAQIRSVIDAWAREYRELGALPYVNAVTIFENRGEMMGASNPHPHCQIWAQRTVPGELAAESEHLAAHLQRCGTCMLCDYEAYERHARERIVFENAGATVIVPFWAVWPFEVLVLTRRHVPSLDACPDEDRDALAQALHELTTRYDRVFNAPFPYSMGWHQQPTDGAQHSAWHAHAHYYPPLLRSATVRKFMVGYEMLADPQRDITPEEAAQRLRSA